MSKLNGKLVVAGASVTAALFIGWIGFTSLHTLGTASDLVEVETVQARHDERIKTVESNIGEIKEDVKQILRQTARDTP